MKVRANGITINYELSGEGDCLVLIHGAGDNLAMWYGQVPVFSRQYRVLTPDVRGHGETECPETPVDMPLLASDLRELLRALNIESAFVLGYSMGGRIGLQLVLDEPSMVRALILAGSSVPFNPPPSAAVERRQRLMAALAQGDLETVSEQMTTSSFSPGLKERDPELFERYKKVKMRNDAKSFAHVWGAMAPGKPPDLVGVSCPVLLVAGEHDAFMPLESVRLTHEAIPGSRLEVLPTGHAVALEAPDDFNRIVLDFLDDVRKKGRVA